MFKIFMFICFLFLNLEASRSIKLSVKTSDGELVPLYDNSYALVIGVSEYTNGWPNLEAIPDEISRIERVLKNKKFSVTKVLNPTSRELKNSIEGFFDKYGYDENNRLLVFFSGHGFSFPGNDKGYLVPADAVNPNVDKKNFMRKAYIMNDILALSRKIVAKHVLFLFDSCFSGTIFKTRALPSKPPFIQKSISLPVRQFITSGSAGEEVPAKSVFAPLFIEAIEGKADLNGDGYITGDELGMFLSNKIQYFSKQTPQYGKINEYDLSRGNFVFISDDYDSNNVNSQEYLHKISRANEKYNIKHFEINLEYSYNPTELGLYNNYLAIGSNNKYENLFNISKKTLDNRKLRNFRYKKTKNMWKSYSIRLKNEGKSHILEIREYGELYKHLVIGRKTNDKIVTYTFTDSGNIIIGTRRGTFLMYSVEAKLLYKLQLNESPIQSIATFHNYIVVSQLNKSINIWKNLEKESNIEHITIRSKGQ